jgi:hypothetical protein
MGKHPEERVLEEVLRELTIPEGSEQEVKDDLAVTLVERLEGRSQAAPQPALSGIWGRHRGFRE